MGPAAAGWPILHALRKYTFFTHSVSYPEIGWPSAGTGLLVELLHAAIMGTNGRKVLRFRDQRAASASWPSDQTRACGDPPTLSLRFSAVTTTGWRTLTVVGTGQRDRVAARVHDSVAGVGLSP